MQFPIQVFIKLAIRITLHINLYHIVGQNLSSDIAFIASMLATILESSTHIARLDNSKTTTHFSLALLELEPFSLIADSYLNCCHIVVGHFLLPNWAINSG